MFVGFWSRAPTSIPATPSSLPGCYRANCLKEESLLQCPTREASKVFLGMPMQIWIAGSIPQDKPHCIAALGKNSESSEAPLLEFLSRFSPSKFPLLNSSSKSPLPDFPFQIPPSKFPSRTCPYLVKLLTRYASYVLRKLWQGDCAIP